MNTELEKVKDELSKVPNLVWWCGAGVVGIVFVVRRMQGTSASSSTVPTDTTSAYTTGSQATGVGDTSGLSTQLSDVETMLQSLINNQNPTNSVTTPTASDGITGSVPISTSPIGAITDWAQPVSQLIQGLQPANFQEVVGALPATSSSPIDKQLIQGLQTST